MAPEDIMQERSLAEHDFMNDVRVKLPENVLEKGFDLQEMNILVSKL